MIFRYSMIAAVLCGSLTLAHAQESASQNDQPASPYSLSLNTKLVVEDVTVFDRQGHPVKGLPASAFHISDDGAPQTLRSFQEVDSTQNAAAAPPAGSDRILTNATPTSNSGPIVVLLLDPSTMQLEDQMYLRIQALKFVAGAPDDLSIAVFCVNHSGVPVLLQPLTRNKAALRKAISASVPRASRPPANAFDNAIAELSNIAADLRTVPGRKSVLWLAGAFPLYQPPEYIEERSEDPSLKRDAFRAVQEARLAIYPIDVRGVQMGGLGLAAVTNNARPLSESERQYGQADEMDGLAEVTGGQAFYSNNDVAGLLQHAVQLATAGYTLSYQPANAAKDGQWHQVKIRVDGSYTVRYRTGYYAPGGTAAEPDAAARAVASNGSDVSQAQHSKHAAKAKPGGNAKSTPDEQPLIFQAQILSLTQSGKTQQVKVRYVIAPDQLLFDKNPAGHAHFQVAALAYNADGDVLSHAMEVIDTHYSNQQMMLAGRIGVPADQTLEIAKGANYILLAVEDLQTQKVGLVQLPVEQARDAAVQPPSSSR